MYRLLEEGEIKQKGDEYYYTYWKPINDFEIGEVCLKRSLPVRRKINYKECPECGSINTEPVELLCNDCKEINFV